MDREKLKELLVPDSITIKQAMQKLSDTAKKILLVVDGGQHLIGTLTDGDIRRSIVNGNGFDKPVGSILHPNPMTLSFQTPNIKEKAKQLMMDRKIQQIPLIDDSGTVVDIISWLDIFQDSENEARERKSFPNQVVIMAGGKGSRLEPFTTLFPKALVPIGEKTIVQIIMERFHEEGFSHFIFTLNYKKEYMKIYLSNNEFPYDIDWIEEDDYRGTAGGLVLAREKIKDTFILSNCDILVTADYSDIMQWHKDGGNLITVIGCHHEFTIPYGVLHIKSGELDRIIEKPQYDVLVNTGLYIMEPEVIRHIPGDRPMDMNELIEIVSRHGKVSIYPIKDNWYDIGQWHEYQKTIKGLTGNV